ncbi:MAG: N-glycosylase/DNA lyase [Candidatus Woesearchaeota archaeon]
MLTHKNLNEIYQKRRLEVKKRLKEFSDNAKNMSLNDNFIELCFCICTPQSKAVKVAQVIHAGNIQKLLNSKHDELAELLKKNTRFHNNKANHIIYARYYLKELAKLPKDSRKAREFLVQNIKGLGYKEASHYLRNIGYRNLCIIDRHVINLMHELGVFSDAKPPSTPKRYLAMEQQITDYAKNHGYDVDELDLVLWSIKTGHVFK